VLKDRPSLRVLVPMGTSGTGRLIKSIKLSLKRADPQLLLIACKNFQLQWEAVFVTFTEEVIDGSFKMMVARFGAWILKPKSVRRYLLFMLVL
jgi:hypothetical protein